MNRLAIYLKNEGSIYFCAVSKTDILFDIAILQLDDPATVLGISLTVGNLNDGHAFFIQLLEEVHDSFSLLGV